jgi:hypothetical protein
MNLLQDTKECFVSGRTEGLHKHHIYGGARRKSSDKYGCWVWLHHEYHTGRQGVHFNREFDLQLKMACQKAFEKKYSRAEFMRIFGRNYLD